MNIDNSIINQLCKKASTSIINQQMAACIIKNNKIISKICCNKYHNILKGSNISTLHAEVNTIMQYCGKSFYFDENQNPIFIENKQNNKKFNLIVIRINKNNELCNARPCYNCLNMMKAANIHKVYYSVSATELICENVKDMISIYISKFYKQNEINEKCKANENSKIHDNKILTLYYENLIKKIFPTIVKQHNLDIFIKYNLALVLPYYSVKLIKKNNINYIIVLNSTNDIIIYSKII